MRNLWIVLATAVVSFGFASTAGAAEFHSSAAPVTLSGTKELSHYLKTNSGTVTCQTIKFSGTMSVKTTSSITLSPDYSECTAFGFINVPFHENGCAYIFYASGAGEIECPVGKKMEITTPGCTTSIGPQTVASNLYSNYAGKFDFKISMYWTGILYNECGTARGNGSYEGWTRVYSTFNSVWYE